MSKEERRKYNKEYRQKNKEVIKKRMKEYYLTNKKHIKKKIREYLHNNKEVIKEKTKEYYLVNKERKKEYMSKCHYKKTYNLTLEEIDELLIKQDHKCALCGTSLLETKRCVDHDHETGIIRGILCYKCNTGLGWFQRFYENPELLKKTVEYIKKSV